MTIKTEAGLQPHRSSILFIREDYFLSHVFMLYLLQTHLASLMLKPDLRHTSPKDRFSIIVMKELGHLRMAAFMIV